MPACLQLLKLEAFSYFSKSINVIDKYLYDIEKIKTIKNIGSILSNCKLKRNYYTLIMKLEDLPKTIPIFPLSNFIMFPETTVPLNIFEPRYLQMVNDSMKGHRMIGMIQPKKSGMLKKPDVYEIGCIGKITSFNETEDGRILIILNGICRFKIISELKTDKLYRECEVQYKNFSNDISKKSGDINFSDLNIIMENMKKFFKKQGYIVNLKDLEKKDLGQTLNDLSMASPFSLEEKQILLESLDINSRKEKMEQILNNYIQDEFENTTLQ